MFYLWIDSKIICDLKPADLSKKVLGQCVILKIWINLSKIASSFSNKETFQNFMYFSLFMLLYRCKNYNRSDY